MNNAELLAKLEAYPSNVPVIIMTPEKDHYLTYRITDITYDNNMDVIVIDVQRSS